MWKDVVDSGEGLWIHQQAQTKEGKTAKTCDSGSGKTGKGMYGLVHMYRVGERRRWSDNSRKGGTIVFRPNNPAALPLLLAVSASAAAPHQPARPPPPESHLTSRQQTRAAVVRPLRPREPSLLLRGRPAKEPSEGGLERAAAVTQRGSEGVERRRMQRRGLVRHWRRCRRLREEKRAAERQRVKVNGKGG